MVGISASGTPGVFTVVVTVTVVVVTVAVVADDVAGGEAAGGGVEVGRCRSAVLKKISN